MKVTNKIIASSILIAMMILFVPFVHAASANDTLPYLDDAESGAIAESWAIPFFYTGYTPTYEYSTDQFYNGSNSIKLTINPADQEATITHRYSTTLNDQANTTFDVWMYDDGASDKYIATAMGIGDSTAATGLKVARVNIYPNVSFNGATGYFLQFMPGMVYKLNVTNTVGWHHFQLYFDENMKGYGYIDGVVVAENITAFPPNSASASGSFVDLDTYSTNVGASTSYYDDVRIYKGLPDGVSSLGSGISVLSGIKTIDNGGYRITANTSSGAIYFKNRFAVDEQGKIWTQNNMDGNLTIYNSDYTFNSTITGAVSGLYTIQNDSANGIMFVRNNLNLTAYNTTTLAQIWSKSLASAAGTRIELFVDGTNVWTYHASKLSGYNELDGTLACQSAALTTAFGPYHSSDTGLNYLFKTNKLYGYNSSCENVANITTASMTTWTNPQRMIESSGKMYFGSGTNIYAVNASAGTYETIAIGGNNVATPSSLLYIDNTHIGSLQSSSATASMYHNGTLTIIDTTNNTKVFQADDEIFEIHVTGTPQGIASIGRASDVPEYVGTISTLSFGLTPSCTSNWVANTYGVCQSNNVSECTSVVDENMCNVAFAGNLADYNNNSCGYVAPCTPNWQCTYSSGCFPNGTDLCYAVKDANVCNEPFNGSLSTYDASCSYTSFGPGICYQNLANKEVACAVDSNSGNGTYEQLFQFYDDGTVWHDADWSTGARVHAYGLSYDSYALATYVKPRSAINGTIQIKEAGTYTNYTVPSECWDASSNISIKFSYGYVGGGNISCNGYTIPGFSMGVDPYDPVLYEMAMFWNMSDFVDTTGFDGLTSDFTNQFSMDNPILEKVGSMKIEWNGIGLDFTGANLASYVTYGSNFVSVDSVNLPSGVNTSANLTIQGSFDNNSKVYSNGVLCEGISCFILSNNGSEIKFLVSHFTNYSVENSSVPNATLTFQGSNTFLNYSAQLETVIVSDVNPYITEFNCSFYLDDFLVDMYGIGQYSAVVTKGTPFGFTDLYAPSINGNGFVNDHLQHNYTMVCTDVEDLGRTQPSLNQTFSLEVRNDTFLPACSWSCDTYAACMPNNVSACTNVVDTAGCGEIFNGTLSTYDQACSYVYSTTIDTTGFDGATTNYSQLNESDVNIPILEKLNFFKIIWNGNNLNFAGSNFTQYVTYGLNTINVDSANLPGDVNTSANVTFDGIFYNPVLLQDGVVCNTCTLISNTGGKATYGVSHFTNYTIYDVVNVTSNIGNVVITSPSQELVNVGIKASPTLQNASFNYMCSLYLDGVLNTTLPVADGQNVTLYKPDKSQNTNTTVSWSVNCTQNGSTSFGSTVGSYRINIIDSINATSHLELTQNNSYMNITNGAGTNYYCCGLGGFKTGGNIYTPNYTQTLDAVRFYYADLGYTNDTMFVLDVTNASFDYTTLRNLAASTVQYSPVESIFPNELVWFAKVNSQKNNLIQYPNVVLQEGHDYWIGVQLTGYDGNYFYGGFENKTFDAGTSQSVATYTTTRFGITVADLDGVLDIKTSVHYSNSTLLTSNDVSGIVVVNSDMSVNGNTTVLIDGSNLVNTTFDQRSVNISTISPGYHTIGVFQQSDVWSYTNITTSETYVRDVISNIVPSNTNTVGKYFVNFTTLTGFNGTIQYTVKLNEAGVNTTLFDFNDTFVGQYVVPTNDILNGKILVDVNDGVLPVRTHEGNLFNVSALTLTIQMNDTYSDSLVQSFCADINGTVQCTTNGTVVYNDGTNVDVNRDYNLYVSGAGYYDVVVVHSATVAHESVLLSTRSKLFVNTITSDALAYWNQTSSSINLTWIDNALGDREVTLTSANDTQVFTTTTNGINISISSLQVGLYNISVKVNESVNGVTEFSTNSSQAVVVDKLEAVTNIQPSNVTLYSNDIMLNWSAATNAYGAVTYTVIVNVNGTNSTVAQNIVDTSLNVTVGETQNGLVYVIAKDSYFNVTANNVPFLLDLTPIVESVSCPATEVYPNEDNYPTTAKMTINASVYAPGGFSGDSMVGIVNATGASVVCVGTTVDSHHKTYLCSVPMQYYQLPGNYSGTFSGNTTSTRSVSANVSDCIYGALLASKRVTSSISFPSAAPGVSNAPGNSPVIVRNTGNVPFNVSLTAQNLYGETLAGMVIYGSDFRAGPDLLHSYALASNVSVQVSVAELQPGLNSQLNTSLWISMASNLVSQAYRTTTPWAVSVQ